MHDITNLVRMAYQESMDTFQGSPTHARVQALEVIPIEEHLSRDGTVRCFTAPCNMVRYYESLRDAHKHGTLFHNIFENMAHSYRTTAAMLHEHSEGNGHGTL